MKRTSTILKGLAKVENMISSNGNLVPNQFIIKTKDADIFQSYDSVICIITNDCRTILDERTWDYSVTTGKYRNMFLGESKKETQAKIDSGEYQLANLN